MQLSSGGLSTLLTNRSPNEVILNVTAINAMQFVIALILIAQIDAGPSPTQLGEPLRVYRYGMDTAWNGMMGGAVVDTPRPFPIARYLAVANYLQSLPERERATWLRMAAALFEDIPFLVASDAAMGTGQAEPSSDYIEYLLANGEWRKTRYSEISTEQLVDVGHRYIKSLRDQGFNVDDSFERSILAQCKVPLKSSKKR